MLVYQGTRCTRPHIVTPGTGQVLAKTLLPTQVGSDVFRSCSLSAQTLPQKSRIQADGVNLRAGTRMMDTVREEAESIDFRGLLGNAVAESTARPPISPRARHNPMALAYLGDSIFEVYARRHFLFPPCQIHKYTQKVTGIVRCETQDAMYRCLIEGTFITQEEREVMKWGRNASMDSSRRAVRRAGGAAYSNATSLEALVGYLYLKSPERLHEVMQHLGFTCGAVYNIPMSLTSTTDALQEKRKHVSYTDAVLNAEHHTLSPQ